MSKIIYGVIERIYQSKFEFRDTALNTFFPSIESVISCFNNDSEDYLNLAKWRESQWTFYGEPIYINNIDNGLEIDTERLKKDLNNSNEEISRPLGVVEWTNADVRVEYLLFRAELLD